MTTITVAESVTSTDVPLFSSQSQIGGTYSFHFFAAGGYRYHSKADLTQRGWIRVKMCTTTKTTLSAGAIVKYADKHHSGWVSDIEAKRKGATSWHWLAYGLVGTQLTFRPSRTGIYYLRARLRHTTNNKGSRFSPPQAISFVS